jgi:hypothetical protein
MKKALVVLMMLATSAHADWRDPKAPFDASTKITTSDTITLTVRQVDNVQQTCDAENVRRGFKRFGYSLTACAFWDTNQCTIITSKRPTTVDYGHELRHCLHGNFH